MNAAIAQVTPGARVLCRDAEWLVTRKEPVSADNSRFAVHCLGVDDLVRGHEAIFLTDIDELEPIDPRETQLVPDTSGGYKLAKLFLEAQLRQMPITDTRPHLEGMGAFEAMDYQRKAVEKALNQLRPRLLLADAVGLGKTIEVGMILTELIERGRGDRILVLTKKSMLAQFQAEIWNRFNIPLVRLDSNGIAKLRLRIPANKNPFEVFHRIIISIDTLKDIGRYRHFLEDTRWDMVVIDEAHNVAGASVPERNLSYRLAKLLSRRTDSMLLTTATPHNGKRATFGRLISLLDPSAIPDPALKKYTAENISPFFLMRFKEDVKAEAGEHFRNREVVPPAKTTIPATGKEESIYGGLAELRATIKKHELKTHHLIEWGLYKRFLSSPEACRSTVGRCQESLAKKDADSPLLPVLRSIEEKLTDVDLAASARFDLLKRELKEIGWNGKPNSPRVLVFTESTVTQDALVAALARDYRLKFDPKQEKQKDQALAIINGSFSDVAQAATIESFATGNRPMRLLIATDVASEGVNLHEQCHHIIHYDLPWSIITLIQRNGRIDRFGQTETPIIRYLMVKTEEGLLDGDREIFDRLVQKVEEINRSTRSGESELKLYDPEKEEEYIAQKAILAGDATALNRQPNESDSAEAGDLEDLLKLANDLGLDELDSFDAEDDGSEIDGSKVRLMKDREFIEQGYQLLAERLDRPGNKYHELQSTPGQLIITPPKELQRRLGAPDADAGFTLGANAIPSEAWPADHQFHLTDQIARVNTAIQGAKQTGSQWSQELLITEQHPIHRWIEERLIMLLPRGQAPLVRSPGLSQREQCFCFIGQVSSKAGTPLILDAHAISFSPGGGFQHRSLGEALNEAGFQTLSNLGATESEDAPARQPLLHSAVEASLAHMRSLQEERRKQIQPHLEKEEQRLKKWYEERKALQQSLFGGSVSTDKMTKRVHDQIEEMDNYVADRQRNWKETNYLAANEPTTRLVLVIEGTD